MEKGRACFTVFVKNLPENFHWQGLYHMFSYYGKVIDSFIPHKCSREGLKFCFVRFSSLVDAKRAISRLDGSSLMGATISASMARFDLRNNFWRRVRHDGQVVNEVASYPEQGRKENMKFKPAGVMFPLALKSCELSLDSNKLERLEKCIVGVCRGCFDTSWLLANFTQQHVYDIWAVRVSTGKFIIGFDNEDRRKSMEENNWDWLGQWFYNTKPWSLEVDLGLRLVEVRMHGLPLVLWKKENLERIAKIWGSLNTVECNIENLVDARVCSVTLITGTLGRIEEKIAVKCGNGIYDVWVSETSRVVQWVDDVVFKKLIPEKWSAGKKENGQSISSFVPSEEDEMCPDDSFRLL